MWIEQFIAPGDIRERYPKWAEFVAASERMLPRAAEDQMDIEVYSAFLLAGAIIGPRVYRNSVRPDLSNEEVITRFRTELQGCSSAMAC